MPTTAEQTGLDMLRSKDAGRADLYALMQVWSVHDDATLGSMGAVSLDNAAVQLVAKLTPLTMATCYRIALRAVLAERDNARRVANS